MRWVRAQVVIAIAGLAAASAASAASAPPVPKHFEVAQPQVAALVIVIHRASGTRFEGRTRLLAELDGPFSASVRSPDRNLRLGGLERGRGYQVEVRACNGGACSAWSDPIESATLLAPIEYAAAAHPAPQCQVIDPTDQINLDISNATDYPVASNSAQIITRINSLGADAIHPDFGANPDYGIPYVVVGPEQPPVRLRFGIYGDESDREPYPIIPNAPVEGGRDSDGDRHVLVVQRPAAPGGDCELFETYRSFYLGGGGHRWRVASGSIFDLGGGLPQRPLGWTSADAAGLPIFPLLARLEEAGASGPEAAAGIDHALRITFEETRRAYRDPASHYASDTCNPLDPPMGMRLRLSADYDISGLSGPARKIAVAMKTYGAIVADNGSNWFISGSTDARWPDDNLNALKDIPGTAFEVVNVAGTSLTVAPDC